MYSLIFERTILSSKAVSVKASMEMPDEQGARPIGSLLFPNQKTWTKFIGAIQRGALDIPDLQVEVIPGKVVEPLKSDNPSVVPVGITIDDRGKVQVREVKPNADTISTSK